MVGSDSRRVRLRARRFGRRRRQAAGAIGRRRQADRRRAFAAPADAAASVDAVAAHRHRPHLRSVLRPRGGRPDRDRRAVEDGRPGKRSRSGETQSVHRAHLRTGRRPAGPPPRDDRRIGGARRPRVRPAGGAAGARRRDRGPRAGRRPDHPGRRVLHLAVRDGSAAERGADGDPRSQARVGDRLVVPEVPPAGDRLGHRRRRGGRRAAERERRQRRVALTNMDSKPMRAAGVESAAAGAGATRTRSPRPRHTPRRERTLRPTPTAAPSTAPSWSRCWSGERWRKRPQADSLGEGTRAASLEGSPPVSSFRPPKMHPREGRATYGW